MRLPHHHLWVRALKIGTRYPALGAALGLALIAVLLPLLTLLGGYTGTLGPSIPLFFLSPVLVSSALGGRTAGVLVSLVATVTWDWFFIPPLHTPTISSTRDALALAVFLVVALLTAEVAAATRRRADDAILRARSSEALYELSTALIARYDIDSVLGVLTRRLREAFDLQACAVLLPDSTSAWRTAATAGNMPPDLRVESNREVAGIASWVQRTGQASGLDGHAGVAGHTKPVGRSPATASETARFLALSVGAQPVGVLGLVYRRGAERDLEREHLLATFANSAAIALEQVRLAQQEQAAILARESDRLKSALLSSVSHDLRTPLAGIKAAASSLLQRDVAWSEADWRTFATDIDTEADRLTRLVTNLLDLSRIEAGALKPNPEWEDVSELIGRVLHRLEHHLAGHHIICSVPDDLPTVYVDVVQMEQVLANLLENAAKFSPPGAPIVVNARVHYADGGQSQVHISVVDRGTGIPPSERKRIFETFNRLTDAIGPKGAGMGLSIVKGFVEANGGRVLVDGGPGLGSTFTVVLSVDRDAAPEAGDRLLEANEQT